MNYLKYTIKSESSLQWIFNLTQKAIIPIFIVALLSGCVTQKKYNELAKEKEQYEQQIATLKVDKELDEYEAVDAIYKKDGVIYEQS